MDWSESVPFAGVGRARKIQLAESFHCVCLKILMNKCKIRGRTRASGPGVRWAISQSFELENIYFFISSTEEPRV